MPVFRHTHLYSAAPTNGGVGWTLNFHRQDADLVATMAKAKTFNDAMMTNMYSNDVRLDTFVVSQEGVWGDSAGYSGNQLQADFGWTVQGAGGTSIPPMQAMLFRGQFNEGPPAVVAEQKSAWYIHGLASGAFVGNNVDEDVAEAIRDLLLDYAQKYRPVATAKYPLVVNPPEDFGGFVWRDTPYFRRLGRPFLQPGQQRRA